MDILLNDREIRVLGSLMEKAMTTPDYYPLSLNALSNACNQKSNRDPVVHWDEQAVEDAVDSLCAKKMANRSMTGRVPKYEQTFTRQRNMVAPEAAVLCALLLRGPQTPGAIRSRSERLHAFDNLEALQETLDRLDEWGLVRRLERLPGHKEARYTHLLAGEPQPSAEPVDPPQAMPAEVNPDRLERLEQQILTLQAELAELRSTFDAFRRQFD
jgi:uncharacterized protein YceH (UPF0502 family)